MIVLPVTFNLSSARTLKSNRISQEINDTNELQSFEIEKLKLEIQKLQREMNPSLTRLIVESPFTPLIIAVLGGIIAVFNVTRTLMHQREQHKEERIANLLENLGNTSESIRLGASQALARYPAESVSFLINQLRIEDSKRVRNGLSQSVSQAGSQYFDYLRNSNVSAVSERCDLIAGLEAIGLSEDKITNLSGLEPKEYNFICKQPRFPHDIEKWKRNESIEVLNDNEVYSLRRKLSEETEELRRFIDGLAQTITLSLKNISINNEKIPSQLTEMDLRWTELNEVKFLKVNFEGTNLTHSILKRNTFSNVIFKGSVLNHADISDSNFEDSIIEETDMVGLISKNVQFSKVTMEGCNLTEAYLSRSTFNSAIFKEISGYNARFNACDMKSALFSNVKLIDTKFMQTNLEKSKLVGSFYRSQFVEAKMAEADLSGADLGGAVFKSADLSNASLVNSKLGGADLSYANLMGANFKGASLTKTKLWSIKQFDEATNFEGTKWWEASFRDQDKELPFYKYLKDRYPPP